MSRIQKFDIDPNPLVAGRNVTVTVQLQDPDSIASVKLYDPRGYELRLKREGEGDSAVFTLTEMVPDDADPGTYYGTLVVTDTSGDIERESVDFRIA